MQSFIQNPQTGRQIKVGGPAYQKLVASGIPVHTLPIVKEKPPRVSTDTGPISEDQMKEIMAMELFESVSPTGSRTRGWSLQQPQKGVQRHRLFEKCGQKCFLGKNETFPICPHCSLYEGDCNCRISCKGATAAFIRANQWKYPEIAKAADRILKEKCGKK